LKVLLTIRRFDHRPFRTKETAGMLNRCRSILWSLLRYGRFTRSFIIVDWLCNIPYRVLAFQNRFPNRINIPIQQ